MALWLIEREPDDGLARYDAYWGFVIRAHNPFRARILASESAGDEGPEVWRDESRTKCTAISEVGSEEIVLSDFNAG